MPVLPSIAHMKAASVEITGFFGSFARSYRATFSDRSGAPTDVATCLPVESLTIDVRPIRRRFGPQVCSDEMTVGTIPVALTVGFQPSIDAGAVGLAHSPAAP